jgi:hypothetical protein
VKGHSALDDARDATAASADSVAITDTTMAAGSGVGLVAKVARQRRRKLRASS